MSFHAYAEQKVSRMDETIWKWRIDLTRGIKRIASSVVYRHGCGKLDYLVQAGHFGLEVIISEIEMSELPDKSRMLIFNHRKWGLHCASIWGHRRAIACLRSLFHPEEGWAQNHPWRVSDKHSRSHLAHAMGRKRSFGWVLIHRVAAHKDGRPVFQPLICLHRHWASVDYLLQYPFDIGNIGGILEDCEKSIITAGPGRRILNGALKLGGRASEQLLDLSLLRTAIECMIRSVIGRVDPDYGKSTIWLMCPLGIGINSPTPSTRLARRRAPTTDQTVVRKCLILPSLPFKGRYRRHCGVGFNIPTSFLRLLVDGFESRATYGPSLRLSTLSPPTRMQSWHISPWRGHSLR